MMGIVFVTNTSPIFVLLFQLILCRDKSFHVYHKNQFYQMINFVNKSITLFVLYCPAILLLPFTHRIFIVFFFRARHNIYLRMKTHVL